MKAALLFIAFIAAAQAQGLLSVSATTQVGAQGSGNLAFNSLLGATGLFSGQAGFAVTTTSSAAFTLTTTLTLDPSFLASSTNLQASANNGGLTFSGSAIGSLSNPLYLTFNSGGAGTGTVTISFTPAAGLGLATSANTQLHLFSSTGGSSADSSTTAYGAVTVAAGASGNYSYTINLPQDGKTRYYFAKADLTKFAIASSSASNNAAFNDNNSFLPVAYNSYFNFQAGSQYQVGNALTIAAQQSSTFAINSATNFDGSSNVAPTAFATGYSYQINSQASANGNVVLRWTGNTATFVGANAQAGANAAAIAANAAWYKTSGSVAASASAWAKYPSQTTVSASGQVQVTAQSSSFSSWTVAGSNNAGALTFTALLVVAAALFAL